MLNNRCADAGVTELLVTANGKTLDQRADEVLLEVCLSGGAGCSFPFPLREAFVERFVSVFARGCNTSLPDTPSRAKWEMMQTVGPVDLAWNDLHFGRYRVVVGKERAKQLDRFLQSTGAEGTEQEFGRRLQKEDFSHHRKGDTFLGVLRRELEEEVGEGDEEASHLLQVLEQVCAAVPPSPLLRRAYRRRIASLDKDVRTLRACITPVSIRAAGQEVLLVGHSNLHLFEHLAGKAGSLRPWDKDPWHVEDIVEALQHSDWFVGRGAALLCNDIYPSHREDLMLNIFPATSEELEAVLPLTHFRAVVICGIPLTQREYDDGAKRFAALLRPGGQLVVSTGSSVQAERLPEELTSFGRFRFKTQRAGDGSMLTSFVRHSRGSVFVAEKPDSSMQSFSS